jgi:hypothetical protein
VLIRRIQKTSAHGIVTRIVMFLSNVKIVKNLKILIHSFPSMVPRLGKCMLGYYLFGHTN